jgi:hypothetical protein
MAQTLASELNQPLNPSFLSQSSQRMQSDPNLRTRAAKARELEPLARAEETRLAEQTGLEEARLKREQIGREEELAREGMGRKEQIFGRLEDSYGQQPERTITAFNPERGIELATMTALLGAFAGSVSGTAALKAMEGVSTGYRTGQEDLYKREVEAYDAAVNQYKQKIKQAEEIAKNSLVLEAEQRGLGAIELKKLDPLLNDGLIIAKAKQGDVRGMLESIKQAKDLGDQIRLKEIEAGFKPKSLTIKTAQVKGSDNKNYLVDVNTFPFGSDPSNVNTKGVIGEAAIKTTGAGSRERNFAQRVFGSIKGMAVDAKNLLTLPSTAAMPEFAGITAEDPNSIFRALIAMTARTITEPEQRAFQQITEQIAQAMANIEGQGLASGATAAKVKAFDALRPKAGDNAINMALYFARVRQELETGIEVFLTNTGANEEQKRQAQEILNNLPEQIPFTVEDVFRKVPGSQQKLSQEMDRLIRQSPVLTELESPEQATAQGPREGDESTSRSGKPIVFTNGNWEYK